MPPKWRKMGRNDPQKMPPKPPKKPQNPPKTPQNSQNSPKNPQNWEKMLKIGKNSFKNCQKWVKKCPQSGDKQEEKTHKKCPQNPKKTPKPPKPPPKFPQFPLPTLNLLFFFPKSPFFAPKFSPWSRPGRRHFAIGRRQRSPCRFCSRYRTAFECCREESGGVAQFFPTSLQSFRCHRRRHPVMPFFFHLFPPKFDQNPTFLPHFFLPVLVKFCFSLRDFGANSHSFNTF